MRMGEPPPEGMKRCPTCRETKPMEMFSKNKGKHDGRQNRCKPCIAVYNHARYLTLKDALKCRSALYKISNRERDNTNQRNRYARRLMERTMQNANIDLAVAHLKKAKGPAEIVVAAGHLIVLLRAIEKAAREKLPPPPPRRPRSAAAAAAAERQAAADNAAARLGMAVFRSARLLFQSVSMGGTPASTIRYADLHDLRRAGRFESSLAEQIIKYTTPSDPTDLIADYIPEHEFERMVRIAAEFAAIGVVPVLQNGAPPTSHANGADHQLYRTNTIITPRRRGLNGSA